MDTINIINNFDQNVLMENILILNQSKLLDLVIKVFEEDFKEITISDLSLDYMRNYFNKLNFINWDLFIRLVNLLTEIPKCNYNYCSLFYLLSQIADSPNTSTNTNTSTKLIEFLLSLPKGIINWKVKTNISKSSTLIWFLHYEKFYSNNNIINLILESDLFDLNDWEYKNKSDIFPAYYLLKYYSEEIVIKAFEKKIIDINQSIIIKLDNKLYNSRPVIHVIKRKLIKALDYLISNGVQLDFNIDQVSTNDIQYPKVSISACFTNNLEIIKILVEKGGINFNTTLPNGSTPSHFINTEIILLYMWEKKYITLDNILFLRAVKFNWVQILDVFFSLNLIKWNELECCMWVCWYLVSNGHFQYTKTVLTKCSSLFVDNLKNGLEFHYLNPQGYWVYDKSSDSENIHLINNDKHPLINNDKNSLINNDKND